MADLSVITAGVPASDGCPVLTRIAAFLVPQGVKATLEHTFRDRRGDPLDLSAYLDQDGTSASLSAAAGGTVALRYREWTGGDLGAPSAATAVRELAGTSPDPAAGVVRARLDASAVERPGIYELSWAVRDAAGDPVVVSEALLSVERSLFPADPATLRSRGGPITLQELRLSLADDPAANLLLDDVEFSDAQLLQAIAEPVRIWNEAPPPAFYHTTQDFPYRGAWLAAAAGRLHVMAANRYRRNVLKNAGGGIVQSDLDREQEYMQEGLRLLQEYRDWVGVTKVALNMRSYTGASVSDYMRRRLI